MPSMADYDYDHTTGETSWVECCPESPDEYISREQSRATLKVFTPWDTRTPQGYKDFLGYTSVAVAGTQKYLSRVPPLNHPRYPRRLWATDVNFKGVTPRGQDTIAGSQMAEFDAALATISMQDPLYNVYTDAQMLAVQALLGLQTAYPDDSLLLRYARGKVEPRCKLQTVPAFRVVKWNSATAAQRLPMTNAAAVPLPEGSLEITLYQVPLTPVSGLNIAGFQAVVNKTNNAALGIANSGAGPWPPGTLLAGMPRIGAAYRMGDDNFACDVTFTYFIYPFGANSFYYFSAPNGGGFSGPGFYATSADGNTYVSSTGTLVDSANNPLPATAAGNLLFPPANFQAAFLPP